MKQLLILVIAFCAFACTPRMHNVIVNKQPSLSPTEKVIVLKKEDTLSNNAIEVGILRSYDNGFCYHCSYTEVIALMTAKAQNEGANILKITRNKEPDMLSTCNRITATLYRVDNPRQYEKEISWSIDRRLTWDDFKGESNLVSDTNIAAKTYCGIEFHTNRVSLFSKVQISTNSTFYCKESWVKENQMHRPDLLEHEQGHFDLCEIYTRRLRKKLIEANLSFWNLNVKSYQVFSDVLSEYKRRQELYEKETNYGLDIDGQLKWNAIIGEELKTPD